MSELIREKNPKKVLLLGDILYGHVPAGGHVSVCGHLHPCIRIQHGQKSYRLSCFAVKNDTIVLPSFGTFTGCSEIVPIHSGVTKGAVHPYHTYFFHSMYTTTEGSITLKVKDSVM